MDHVAESRRRTALPIPSGRTESPTASPPASPEPRGRWVQSRRAGKEHGSPRVSLREKGLFESMAGGVWRRAERLSGTLKATGPALNGNRQPVELNLISPPPMSL